VRAAAKLALEDQAAAKQRLTAGGSRGRQGRYSADALAAEALAAEALAAEAANPGEEYLETKP
jgi:hypothetical protein